MIENKNDNDSKNRNDNKCEIPVELDYYSINKGTPGIIDLLIG
jgi:hypothetical protein